MTHTLLAQGSLAVFALAAVAFVWQGLQPWQGVLAAALALPALAAALYHSHRSGRTRAALAITTDGEGGRAEPCVHDECELKQLRRLLEARESERMALQRTVGEFERVSRSVSHDLRSPLGAVSNFAAILAEDYGSVLDASANKYLRRISSNVKSAVTLMDGLLEFADSGREEIHKAGVAMWRLVENVCDDLIGTAPQGALEIGDLPDAYADPEMMRRVFTNLISNAWKFVEPGAAPRVAIGGERTADELVYFVRDQGIGFDTLSGDRLFNEFERLHVSAFEGHGIGLAIVARLVRRHGGRVWARGEAGKGATFLFSLPLPPAHVLELEAARELRDASGICSESGDAALVLPGSVDVGRASIRVA